MLGSRNTIKDDVSRMLLRFRAIKSSSIMVFAVVVVVLVVVLVGGSTYSGSHGSNSHSGGRGSCGRTGDRLRVHGVG